MRDLHWWLRALLAPGDILRVVPVTFAARERREGSPLTGRRRSRIGPAAFGALLLVASPGTGRGEDGTVERFTGTARVGDGSVLYREEHIVRRNPERLVEATTTYRDSDGRVIATLHTDFSRDPFAPSYEFRDLRSGTVEKVEVSAREVELHSPKGARTVQVSEAQGTLVTGQGLDRLLRARLDLLSRGEELEVNYAIPSRLDTYGFHVHALGGSPSDPTVRVRVEISSWILRILAPSLDVEYSRATQRLLRYRGVSNLRDSEGEYPEVEIVYAYPDDPGSSGRHASL